MGAKSLKAREQGVKHVLLLYVLCHHKKTFDFIIRRPCCPRQYSCDIRLKIFCKSGVAT